MGGESVEKKQNNRRKAHRLFGRSIRSITAALFVFVMGAIFTAMPCMAAKNNTIEKSGSSASKDVYAKYESSKEDEIASSPVTGGTASLTLADGTVITVSAAADGLHLKVFTIPQEDQSSSAWLWFTAQMEGKGTKMRPYDIWFEDVRGQVREVGGAVRIAITLPSGTGYQNPVVYYLPSQGSPENMNASYAGGTVSFQTTHNSYYVLLEQPSQGGTDTEEKPEQTSAKKTAQTGDPFDIFTWLIILGVSLFVVGGIGLMQNKE